jgi:MOSC domain-containing protein
MPHCHTGNWAAGALPIGHDAPMSQDMVGVVSSIRRYPVKSMLGEELDTATLSERGLSGDRAYALVDDETGKVISAKRPKRWKRMFELAATTEPEAVRVAFPDGSSACIGDPELPKRLSAFFGRPVSVVSAPPADATFEEEWVGELKNGARPYLGMPSRMEEGDELIDAAFIGAPGFFDFGALHIVTSGTLRRLTELAPGSRFDVHRFRPNVVVETENDGFVETGWQNRTLMIGEVRLSVSITVPRCVMTTLAQGDLPPDREVLRAISQHNSVEVVGTPYPCVGVYADVMSGGVITGGDPVTLE